MIGVETDCKIHRRLDKILDNGGIGDKLFELVVRDSADKLAKALMGAIILEGENPEDYRHRCYHRVEHHRQEGGRRRMTEHIHEYICPYCMAEMTVRHSFADSAMVHKHRKCPACNNDMIHATGNVWNIRYHLEELQKAIADVEKREEEKGE